MYYIFICFYRSAAILSKWSIGDRASALISTTFSFFTLSCILLFIEKPSYPLFVFPFIFYYIIFIALYHNDAKVNMIEKKILNAKASYGIFLMVASFMFLIIMVIIKKG